MSAQPSPGKYGAGSPSGSYLPPPPAGAEPETRPMQRIGPGGPGSTGGPDGYGSSEGGRVSSGGGPGDQRSSGNLGGGPGGLDRSGDLGGGPGGYADEAAKFAGYPPAAAGHSALRLVWIYPDLLSTYGDRGNLLMLARRARLRGIGVEAVEVHADRPVPRQGDIYLLGGGEDLPQVLAARRLRADGGLAAAAANGAVVFAVCAGYQLAGAEFGGAQGEPVEGLGILDVRSGRGARRGVGEVVADVDSQLGVPRLTGFENHQGITRLGPGVRPLATVVTGVGNGDGTEGAYAGRVLGTYLHGPALVRNPGLADLLLTWATGPLAPMPEDAERWTAQLRQERLAATAA